MSIGKKGGMHQVYLPNDNILIVFFHFFFSFFVGWIIENHFEDFPLAIPTFFLQKSFEQNGESGAPNAIKKMKPDFGERLDLLAHVKFAGKITGAKKDSVFGNTNFVWSEFVPFLKYGITF